MNDEPTIITPAEAELYDCAKRTSDAVNLHVLALRALPPRDRPAFVGIRLGDGSSDGVLYDTRAEAMRHAGHDLNVFPVKLGRSTMSVREAMIVIKFARMARARGVVFAEEDVQRPHLNELLNLARVFQNRTLLRGDPE